VPIATTSVAGIVKPDGVTIDVNVSGQISVPTATGLAFGLVKPDGTTITISSGVISSVGDGGGGGFGPPLTTTPTDPDGGTSYTLSATPTTPTASFYFVNGVKRIYGAYYSISGNTLTILADVPPQDGDTHEIYAY